MAVLRHFDCTVRVPLEQTCCGQPAYNNGLRRPPARLVDRLARIFEPDEYVVSPSASCVAMVTRHGPELFGEGSEARAVQMNVVPAQTAALRSVVEDLLAPEPGAGILLEPALSERYPSLREISGAVSHPDEEELFAAAAGVVSVSAAIAETGSIVLVSGADRPRSTALVPITVVAVVGESQIVADLYDWLASLDPLRMPAESVIVTGPSRTADIGMNLVIGVHGPGAVHIVLLTDA